MMAAAYSLSLGIGGFVVVALGARGTYLVGGLGVIGAAFVGMARAAQAGRRRQRRRVVFRPCSS